MPQFTPADLAVWLSPWMGQLAMFVLVLARVSGLLAVGPLLGRAILPWQARIGLAIVLSMLLTSLVGSATSIAADVTILVPAAATEFGLGFMLGCGSLLILWSIPLAGRLLDQQQALPADDDDDFVGGSPIARWLTLWGAACFLLCSPINGHLQAVKVLADSFQAWPLGSASELLTSNVAAQLLQQSCQLALLLIAPALATLTLANLALGLLSAAGLAGASNAIGPVTRSVVAAVVLMASLTGIQQHISDFVRDGIAIMAGDSTSATTAASNSQ